MQIFAGTTALSTSTGNQTCDLSGKMTATPKLAIHQCNSATIANSLIQPLRYSMGVTDGTTQRAIGLLSEDGDTAALTAAVGRYDTAHCLINTVTSGNGLDSWASHVSFGAGAHTINIDDAPLTGLLDQFVLIGGADVEVAIVDFTSDATQDTPKDATGSITDPNLAIVFGRTTAAFAANTGFNPRTFTLGYAVKTQVGAIEQFCWSDTQANNTTNCRSILRSNRCGQLLSAGASGGAIELTTWLSNGATFTSRDAVAGAISVVVVFLKVPNALRAMTTLLDSSADGQKVISGVGFTPKAYFTVATRLAALDTAATDTTASKFSHSLRDQAGDICMLAGTATDGAASGESFSLGGFGSAAVAYILNSDGTDHWIAVEDSIDADGVTLGLVTEPGAVDNAVGFLFIGPDVTVNNETVSVTEGQVLQSQHQAVIGETVSITEGQVLLHSAFLADETVGISEGQVLVPSAFLVDEAVEISEGAVFASTAILAEETVEISEGQVLVTEASNDVALIVDETVEVSEGAVFHTTWILESGETVSIEDGVLVYHSTFQANEDVEILEGVVFHGEGVLATVNEDVEVSDAVVAFLGSVLGADETVAISDDFTFGEGPIARRVGPARNQTVQGGAALGSTSQGGSVKGRTEG